MFNTIEEYLDALKNEMKDADPALVQDAQADAREHLSSAMVVAHEFTPQLSEADAFKKIIEEYGTPEETASAYREVERRTSASLKPILKPRTILGRFFGVYTDPRAWGALLYMLIAFITGIFYFVWAVTGASVSISLLILIIGAPLAILFLLSVRGLALIEGRLVEALLGIRMPRRPLFSHPDMNWLDRLKALLGDRATWLMLVYMIIQFVLGIIYFTVIVTVFSISVSFILVPFGMVSLDYSGDMILNNNDLRDIFSPWTYPLLILTGILLWTGFMNVVREVGQLHGRMAKWMLVTEQDVNMNENAQPVNKFMKFLQFPLIRIILGLFILIAAPSIFQWGSQALVGSDSLSADAIVALAGVASGLLAYYGFVRIVERRRVTELAPEYAPKELALGALVGAALFSTTIGILWLLGYYQVSAVHSWTAIVPWLITGIISGTLEELLVRGILFRIMEESLGTWIALVISALIFGAGHLANPNATLWAGLAIAIEAGIMLAAAYVLTRRLWVPIGIHIAWNFVQGGIFGVAVSGNEAKGLLQSTLSGPTLLSGGEFGAEASIFAVIVCLAAGVFLVWKSYSQGKFIQPYWNRKYSNLS